MAIATVYILAPLATQADFPEVISSLWMLKHPENERIEPSEQYCTCHHQVTESESEACAQNADFGGLRILP
jgi:hypothetical protein